MSFLQMLLWLLCLAGGYVEVLLAPHQDVRLLGRKVPLPPPPVVVQDGLALLVLVQGCLERGTC